MIVSFRFGDRWDVRHFITPDNPEVAQIARACANLDGDDRVIELWRHVCEEIRYPFDTLGNPDDTHRLQAFALRNYPLVGQTYRINRSNDDFWQLSAETLAWGIGDCEDTSVLLCSLLRCDNFCSADEVFVDCGTIGGWGHAWVNWRGYILETTLETPLETPLDSLPPSPLRTYNSYQRQARFNDRYAGGNLQPTDRRAYRAIEAAFGHRTKMRPARRARK